MGAEHDLRHEAVTCSCGERFVPAEHADALAEAIDTHRAALDRAALHGPTRDRDDVDNDLYNTLDRFRQPTSASTGKDSV